MVLDRNSGDFWVVSSLGAAALKLLQQHGSLAWPELERRLALLEPDADLGSSLLPTMKSLADNGLIRPVEKSVSAAVLMDGQAR